MIDLHVHTNHSDGVISPTRVIKFASEKGLSAIAITDHDGISAIDEAVQAGNHFRIEVISGIEFSTEYYGKNIHIVGLLIDSCNERLLNVLSIRDEARKTRNKNKIKKLISLGFDKLTYDELLVHCNMRNFIYNKNIAEYVLSRYPIMNRKEFSRKYLYEGGLAYFEHSVKKLAVNEAIDVIHNAGGIAIWAHPLNPYMHSFTNTEVEELLSELKKIGLDGIEAYYTDYTQGSTLFALELARKYQLLISGGSDYHGDVGGDLGVGHGNLNIPYTLLQEMQNYIDR